MQKGGGTELVVVLRSRYDKLLSRRDAFVGTATIKLSQGRALTASVGGPPRPDEPPGWRAPPASVEASVIGTTVGGRHPAASKYVEDETVRIASLGEPPTPHPQAWSIDDATGPGGSDESDESDDDGDGVRDDEIGGDGGVRSVDWGGH